MIAAPMASALSAHPVTPATIGHQSKLLPLFVENLEKNASGRALDVGRVCDDNILFFGHKVKKLFVCDLFTPLSERDGKYQGFAKALGQLDYPQKSFDGILLWDLCDRLNDEQLNRLIKQCHSLLQPRGQVFLFTTGRSAEKLPANFYTVSGDFIIEQRFRPDTHLSMYYRPNRDILAKFHSFSHVKSYIYRNRFIEFLFRRE